MRSTAAVLGISLLLMGSSCEKRPDPPTATQIKVPVPVPCQVAEPVCQPKAYDKATKDQPGDQKIKALRAETISQDDCVRQYREALKTCR